MGALTVRLQETIAGRKATMAAPQRNQSRRWPQGGGSPGSRAAGSHLGSPPEAAAERIRAGAGDPAAAAQSPPIAGRHEGMGRLAFAKALRMVRVPHPGSLSSTGSGRTPQKPGRAPSPPRRIWAIRMAILSHGPKPLGQLVEEDLAVYGGHRPHKKTPAQRSWPVPRPSGRGASSFTVAALRRRVNALASPPGLLQVESRGVAGRGPQHKKTPAQGSGRCHGPAGGEEVSSS